MTKYPQKVPSATSPSWDLKRECAPYAALLVASAWIGVGVSYAQLYLFHIALGLFLWRFSAHACSAGKLTIPSAGFLCIPVIYFLWMIFSLVWAQDTSAAVRHVVYHGLGTTLLLAVVVYYGRYERPTRILLAVWPVIFLELLIAIAEFTTPFRYPISPYSSLASHFGHSPYIDSAWSDAMIQLALSSPTGFHWNPNTLAAALVISLPFFLFHSRPSIRRIGSTIVVAVIFFTASRASYIGCVVVLLVWGLFFSSRRAAGFVIASLAVASIGALGVIIAKERGDQRVEAVIELVEIAASPGGLFSGGSGRSVDIRGQLMQRGMERLVESRGVGIGGGNSRELFLEPITRQWKPMPLHNFWLEVVVEAGVVVGLLFIAWYIWVMRQMFRIAYHFTDKELRYLASASGVAMLAFVPAAVSASSVMYFLPMWLLLGLAGALLARASELPRGAPSVASRPQGMAG